MGVVKSRGATKRLGPISLGRLVQIKPSNVNRKFGVHEDLLCATSTVFKNRLQQRRKPIDSECPVCSEELDATTADITFCRSECGQNVHVHCLEQWKQSTSGHLTCPMCRKTWKDVPVAEVVELSSAVDLDPRAVQTYVDWLYTESIRVDPSISPETDEYNVYLLKAWTVSTAVADFTFQHAVIALFISQMESKINPGFGLDAIRYAFQAGTSDKMKMSVAMTCHAFGMAGNLSLDAASLPDAFSRQIKILRRRMQKTVLSQSTNGDYKLEEEDKADT